MLLGYNKDGDIKFIFTDEKYLKNKYPNNSAKISNFWGTEKHGLTEFFVSIQVFKDWDNAKNYKIIDGKITQKEVKKEDKSDVRPIMKENISTANETKELKDIKEIKISNIEITGSKE